MSAITGIFFTDGTQLNPEEIRKMNECLNHRGPDESNTWNEGAVGLGHQMLHTTPESIYEKLPFEDKGLVITADARIDNRKELSEKLDIENQEENSDSYFILKAYQKWGEDCPNELLGDFAFAIWDKNKEQLFCARDHMGVKPFYYFENNDIFYFASEIKAILSGLHQIPNISQQRIAKYLVSIPDDTKETFYENIFRLPAAHYLTISSTKSYIKQYWALNPEYELEYDSDKKYQDAFINIFSEAVKCRLRSAFPVGSMLSGGLDSSSIVSMASKTLKDTPLKTFSAIFDEVKICDESYYIKKVIEKWNLEPYFIHGDSIGPLADVDTILWYLDEPNIPPNIFINWNCNNLAQNNGVRILLDGYGGDTVVSLAREFLVELALHMRWNKLLKEIKGYSKRQNINQWNMFFNHVINPLTPEILRNFWNKIRRNGLNCHGNLIKREIAQKNEIFDRIDKLNKNTARKKLNSKDYQHYMLTEFGIQTTLEILDKTSAAFSIEPRYPFFDKRLVEFCLAIPTDQKRVNGWDRAIMRRSLNNILPKEIKCRSTKSNLTSNFNRSLKLYELSKIEHMIKNPNGLENYVDITEFTNAYTKFKNNEQICSLNLWLPATLNLWLRNKIN